MWDMLHACRKSKIHIKFYSKNHKGQNNFGDLDMDSKTILRGII
jgi:hypothetical protein